MKVSTTPTGTIAISARTGSEWDSVDFAIFHITEQTIRDMRERLECLTMVKDSRNFAGLRYWDGPDGWYMYSDEETNELYDALQNKEWVYIIIEDDDECFLTAPEQIIDDVVMKIQTDRSLQFVGHGKHTAEEFWTSDVPMDQLIKDFETVLLPA